MIHLVSTGVSREVLLVGRWAAKVPKLRYGWRAFLHGLLANMQEAQWGEMAAHEGDDHFCPVVWALPGGWLVVQRRARPLTYAEWMALDVDDFLERGTYAIPAERKQDSFGILDGRVVAVDFGN